MRSTSIGIMVGIYDFVKAYEKEHKYAPCIREIGDAVGLKSSSSVHRHIVAMLEKGYLETDAEDVRCRAIRVGVRPKR